MLASTVQVPTPGMAHSLPSPGAGNEFDMLQRFFVDYTEALREPNTESSKARLSSVMDQRQAKGWYGNDALALLQKYSPQINWQGMNPEVYNSFYRFVYFICREPNKRNVQVATAVLAWRLILCGRFRLLDRFCSFVSTHHKSNVILEDTWRQVLDFSRTVHEDLSNYDSASAWPVLLDEFVEHVKGSRHVNRPLAYVNVNLQPLDLLVPWSVRPMTAVSPRSGSKRRPPDVLEVADQLQQLPLETSEIANNAIADNPISDSGAANNRRVMLSAKRLRMGGSADISSGSPQHEGGPHNSAAMQGYRQLAPAAAQLDGRSDAVMHVRRVAGGAGATHPAGFGHMEAQQQHPLEFTRGCMGPPGSYHPTQHHHNQQRTGMRAGSHGPPGVAGLLVRDSSAVLAPPGPQQQLGFQQQVPGGGSPSFYARRNNLDSSRMDVSVEIAEQSRQQQQQQMFTGGVGNMLPGLVHAATQLPPCPSPSNRIDFGIARRNLERTHSLNAMMHVTVTEALGFN